MNKPYFLALNRIAQIGPRTVSKLLTRWPNLEELFQCTTNQLVDAGLSTSLAAAISSFDLNQVEIDLRWEEEPLNHLITWEDEHYPSLLLEIYDPPPVLYARGDLTAFNQAKVAMVGSRKPTIIGAETAHRFAYELARQHIAVVSGLALGIDAEAHQGALKANGCTIAAMATGMDRIYPNRHQALAERIIKNGLLLTEFPLGTSPIPGHFPRRNRIISGLSLATLVVEAAIKSGSLITARMALEQNRDVFAIPGSIHNPQARGCHHLLQQGAKLVTSTEDILMELNLSMTQSVDSQPLIGLAIQNENLVKCIGFEVTTVDQISARSGYNVEQVACELADLEIKGIVKAVPGGYMRCMI
ncbi:DNA-processing protein DprA [Legionella impletisoli]|uniref:DNA protecting protein DprA n=1 Tax=Legionella impletisoli TaxID=343510 RepID=A0A917JVN3_9GAMM|nr:DNA-processing protein DprA [Legionella impletisoli]GGI88497.1 DNA protecting protein DprA [Legionella impletisoli]